jgi:hypothetical protein
LDSNFAELQSRILDIFPDQFVLTGAAFAPDGELLLFGNYVKGGYVEPVLAKLVKGQRLSVLQSYGPGAAGAIAQVPKSDEYVLARTVSSFEQTVRTEAVITKYRLVQ